MVDRIPWPYHEQFTEDTYNENEELRLNFWSQIEFSRNNMFFNNKEQQKYTFHCTRGYRSIILYILTNRNTHHSQILDIRCLSAANINNNKFEKGTIECKKNEGRTTWRFVINRFIPEKTWKGIKRILHYFWERQKTGRR